MVLDDGLLPDGEEETTEGAQETAFAPVPWAGKRDASVVPSSDSDV